MAKYHLNPATGNPGACTAQAGNCPYGDVTHYDSPEAARQAYEGQMSSFRLRENALQTLPPLGAAIALGESRRGEVEVNLSTQQIPWGEEEAAKLNNAMALANDVRGLGFSQADWLTGLASSIQRGRVQGEELDYAQKDFLRLYEEAQTLKELSSLSQLSARPTLSALRKKAEAAEDEYLEANRRKTEANAAYSTNSSTETAKAWEVASRQSNAAYEKLVAANHELMNARAEVLSPTVDGPSQSKATNKMLAQTDNLLFDLGYGGRNDVARRLTAAKNKYLRSAEIFRLSVPSMVGPTDQSPTWRDAEEARKEFEALWIEAQEITNDV